MKNRLRKGRMLNLESLESRLALAGNVTVGYEGTGNFKDLVITGDNLSNELEIVPNSTIDNFIIRGLNNTKINNVNNGTFRFNIYNFTDDMRIYLKGGNDKLYMAGADSDIGDLDVWNDLEIFGGTGSDRIELRYVETGGGGTTDSDIYIDTGTGADFVKGRYIDVQDDFRIVNSTDSQSAGVKARADLYDTYVGDDLDIDFYNTVGIVNLKSVSAKDLTVDLHGQDDKLNVKSSRARSTYRFNGGAGNDDLNLYSNTTSFVAQEFKTPTRQDTWYS